MIMVEQDNVIKGLMDQVKVVSFDVFDTLIKRIVNTPEDVFSLVEKKCGIRDFRELRIRQQMKASIEQEQGPQQSHATYDQIYEYIKKHNASSVDWDIPKETELQAEAAVLVANERGKELFEYAKQLGKRVIATSDMYLQEKELSPILEKLGYKGFDAIYISADAKHTKYNKDLYEYVCKEEHVKPNEILHIGDNLAHDIQNARACGLQAEHFEKIQIEEDKKYENAGLFDYGLAEHLYEKNDNFWYRLGASVGGPLYMGIENWFSNVLEKHKDKNVFFLARDGYNLYQLMKDKISQRCEYLYASRRSMLFAGVTRVDEDAIELLPPFTLGQSIADLVEMFELPNSFVERMSEVGFSSKETKIDNHDLIAQFKRLYKICEKDFLAKCEKDRQEAVRYLDGLGFFDRDAVVFDCGWNGSSQLFLDKLIEASGKKTKTYFYYVGILDTEKSKAQLSHKNYEAFLFDRNREKKLQTKIVESVAILELFFGAPQDSVLGYKAGKPVFEELESDYSVKENICKGICDFVNIAYPVAKKYQVTYKKEQSLGGLMRLLDNPTEDEAVTIGNLSSVDGFANQKGTPKYIAYVDEETYLENPRIEIYWPQGFFKRSDIGDGLKGQVAKTRGYSYTPGATRVKKSNTAKMKMFIKRRFKFAYQLYLKYRTRNENNYNKWIEKFEIGLDKVEVLAYNPKFSIVIPVYNTIDQQLTECFDSVLNQTYKNYELILVDDCSTWDSVGKTLKKYEKHEQVRVIYRKENGNISKTTNDGIAVATGDYIVFSDCDDVLSVNALYELAKKLNENPEYDFVYSDEDKLSEDGKRRHSPFFKPDWSPDTFMALMYTNHLATYRASLVKQTGGLRTKFNGAQDYDFTLRFMELSDNTRVGHVQKVLYHWRERKESIASNMQAKPYALTAMENLKKEALERRGLQGEVIYVPEMSQYRVVYKNPDNPLVSIIIPSKDNYDILMQCLNSIWKCTEYLNYEIILVDNGSSEQVKAKLEALAEEKKLTYIYEKKDFNFSYMCNQGAKRAKGEYLLFLNDDIEICQKDWLNIMVGQASLSHIGAVGAKLYYPKSDLIQHIGITNLQVGPSHNLLRMTDKNCYYFGRNWMNYNVLAVTGACLMVQTDKYKEVGAMDEKLPIAYNDVDLCFSLHDMGYYNVMRNDVQLFHHESVSRGSDDISEEKQKRLAKEREYLYSKHPALYGQDPFYNPNLAKDRGDFALQM